MKKRVTDLSFWFGPGALLALIIAMSMTAEAQVMGKMSPDDTDCPGPHFCDDEPGDRNSDRDSGPDGTDQDERRQDGDGPDDVSDEFGMRFLAGDLAVERLKINRYVAFENIEINHILGRPLPHLRGYELVNVRVVVVEPSTHRPYTPRSDLALRVSGRVHDSMGLRPSGRRTTTYELRTRYGIIMGPRAERVQLTVHGEVFVSEIQLSFRRSHRP